MKKVINDTTYYDMAEMIAITGFSRAMLNSWCQTGKLPASKVAGKWWVDETVIHNLFKPDSKEVSRNQSDPKQVQPPL